MAIDRYGKARKRAENTESSSLQPTNPEIGIEMGVGQIFPNSIFADTLEGNGATLLNNPHVTIDQLTDMRRRDGQAKALIQLVTLPMRLALSTGEWVAPDGDDDAAEEVQFANDMWSLPPSVGGMSTPKNKVIRQMLLSLTDGFSAFEEVRDIAEDGPLKGKLILKKLAYRDARTIKFKVDEHGGFRGFRQTTINTLGEPVDVYIKTDKAFVITQHDELNPHYGVSLFESAYPHFDAKRKLYYIAHIAAQFAAVPGRVGEVPFGARASDVRAFNQALGQLAFNGAMSHPVGYKVTPLNGNSGFDFLKLIDHHNHMMSKSILAPFFDQENRTVIVENGSDNSDADMFLNSIETIVNDIAENMTHYLMPRYINWNFDSKLYPVFKPGSLSDSARKTIKEMFTTVVTASVLNSTPEFVRALEIKVSEEAGLDIDYDEIAAQEKEAAEAKAIADEEAAAVEQQSLLQAEQAAAAGGGNGQVAPGQSLPDQPGSPKPPKPVALSNSDDPLEAAYAAAAALLETRPDDTNLDSPVDDL